LGEGGKTMCEKGGAAEETTTTLATGVKCAGREKKRRRKMYTSQGKEIGCEKGKESCNRRRPRPREEEPGVFGSKK